MSRQRNIRRVMRHNARATTVVLVAEGDELSVSVVGPQTKPRTTIERENDRALRRLAEAARDFIGECTRPDESAKESA